MTTSGPAQDVVIFGAAQFASLAWYVLTHDSPHRVVGFTADRGYCPGDSMHGVPVVPFDELGERFPPDRAALLVALGGREINGLRMNRYLEAKRRGYGFVSYVSSRALVWPDLDIGENCMVFDGVAINPFASVGNNCILRTGAMVSHHAIVGDHCYLAAHAVVAGAARVGERCFVGLNSTVRDRLAIAPRCFIAAGAVVTADTSENGVYVGVPARRRDTPADQLEAF